MHNLPVVSDLRAAFPEVAIDWVVEEGLVAIPRLHPAVRHVIPVGLRRWRKNLLTMQSWREMAAFRRELQNVAYDLVLDTQGLIKSGLILRQARLTPTGRRCGYVAEAAREPLAARFYDAGFAVSKQLHAVERNRWLAAAVLGYTADKSVDYGIAGNLARTPDPQWLPAGAYAVLLTATSRDDKLWPESDWLRLGTRLAESGLRCILPAGTPVERERAIRLSGGIPGAVVAPPLDIGAIAHLCAGARLVVGVDTGLTHLAVALERPVVALFCDTDPGLTGVYAGAATHLPIRNLGGPGRRPTAQEAIAAALSLLG